MKAACAQIRSAVILAPMVLFTFQSPLLAGVARSDSQELATLLEQASDEARELAIDAEDLQTLIVNDQNWLTHTLKLAKIKGHVDNMSLIVDKLTRAQKSGSELQEQALQRILPLVKELQANTTAAMNYLNQNKDRPVSDAYKQYLEKNAETARQLSSIISALDDYEKSMTEINSIRSKLTGSGAGK
jgi:histidyl-tRNA synthetase